MSASSALSPARSAAPDSGARLLEHGDRIAGRSRRADDLERREDVGEFVGVAGDQAFEGHALVEVDAVLHDEMLVAGMEDVRVHRWNDLDGEVVRTDDDDLQARKPLRALQHDTGGAVVKGLRFRIPARAMAGANE